jgi:hypothetical protein
VLEKPESSKSEGLCAVRSSKARRLKRIGPGFFNPPTGRPICGAGLHWLGLLISSRHSAPRVAAMEWWTNRFDRGFASGPWLSTLLENELRFVLRWKKGQKLLDGWAEERKAWEIARVKRSWSYRWLRDTRTGEQRKVGMVALAVNHPSHAQPLWLVVARPGNGQEPWYLLTSELIRTADGAWEVVLAYARRWQIEMSWRYSKSELLEALREAVLRSGCHWTGKRGRPGAAPLYRLRSALSRLWQAAPPLLHPQR